MREYIANGAQLGWLIDPLEKRVFVYEPGQEVMLLENPATVSGELVLPGFVLSLDQIW
jgi:Uma2 family endonuclease